jgi:hypothetical protein
MPSPPVMPIVNRPVPELKAGWPSASALREFDLVSFAITTDYATNEYIVGVASLCGANHAIS